MDDPAVIVNASQVVHETIDGETILIHLGTGTYYSLDGVGADVWGCLAAGSDWDDVLASAQDRYVGDLAAVEIGLSNLRAELLREGLVVEADVQRRTPLPPPPMTKIPYDEPVLSVYTDMQEFMLVDPLHEVDEVAGWPNAKSG